MDRLRERVCSSVVAGLALIQVVLEEGRPCDAKGGCTAYTALGWRVVMSPDGWVKTVVQVNPARRRSPKKAAKRSKQARRERIRLATMP